MDNLAYNIPEFCRLVGISVRHFANLRHRGEAPPTVRLGRRRIIRKAAAEQWLKDREVTE